MAEWDGRLPVVVVGGGMITQEVILPTLFQERRRGRIGRVVLASRRAATIRASGSPLRASSREALVAATSSPP